MTLYPLRDGCSDIIKRLYFIWKMISYMALIVYIVTSILDIYMRENKDIADVSTNMLNTALYVGAVVRLSYYTIYGYKTKNLIRAMNEKFVPKVYYEEDENVDMMYYVRLSDRGSLLWMINVYSTTQLMSFVPLIFHFPRYNFHFCNSRANCVKCDANYSRLIADNYHLAPGIRTTIRRLQITN